MKIPNLIYIPIIICALALWASCSNPQPQKVIQPVQSAVTQPTLIEPFRYHKLIESSPGKYFDVLSWGRGKDSTGSYLILHSDSTGKKYTTVTGDLEGAIIDVYNTDMNMDGNPEILIEAKAKDTVSRINMYVYEYKGGKAQKIEFPKLSTKSKAGYRGDDNIYIKEGSLIREFPVYDGTGKDAKPTGQKKVLQYGIRDKEFTVKDISPADTAKTIKTATKDTVKKPIAAAAKPSGEKPRKAEKHKRERHKAERRHKRRRHRREE